jgi:hypothetical protein
MYWTSPGKPHPNILVNFYDRGYPKGFNASHGQREGGRLNKNIPDEAYYYLSGHTG